MSSFFSFIAGGGSGGGGGGGVRLPGFPGEVSMDFLCIPEGRGCLVSLEFAVEGDVTHSEDKTHIFSLTWMTVCVYWGV